MKTSAVRPSVDGRTYHLRVKQGEVARYVLLPGDPARAELIAKTWDEYRVVAKNREFWTYTGKYKGVKISVTSTGIGGPSTAIAIEELLQVGADTFIRVGTTASLREDVNLGDIVIDVAAVRFDGTSKSYIFPEYPAVADIATTLALIMAAEELGVRYYVGITASTDSFYVGQERPGFKGYLPPWSKGLIELLRSVNVLNFEMEAATIFTLANVYGVRAGCVCAVIANRVRDEFKPEIGVENAIAVANEAVRILSEWDSITKEGFSIYRAIREWLRR